MALRTVRIDGGPFDDLDIGELGARAGLLWRSSTTTLAGVGAHRRIRLTRPAGGAAAQAAIAELAEPSVDDAIGHGPVAFAAMPFDRSADAELIVPEFSIGEQDGQRWVTHEVDRSWSEIETWVAGLMSATSDAGAAADPTITVQEVDARSPDAREIAITPSMPASEWRDGVVARAIDELGRRGMRKVVLARELLVEADPAWHVPAVVASLARRFPGAILFSVDGFVGASPELLVARSGRTVRAQPLAGTAARGGTEETDRRRIDDLLASTKDQTEHRITIDWLLHELLPFCSYVDAEPDPSVVTLANVHHLATLVEGVLSEPAASVLDLVAAVHPTPAVGGAPQDDAIELIGSLENFDRGRYAGPTGWVDAHGNGEFAVSVRSAQFDGAHARVCAGVGVVAASDPDAELAETQTKFRAMLGSLLR